MRHLTKEQHLLRSVIIWLSLIAAFYIEISILNHRYQISQEVSSVCMFIASLILGIIPIAFHRFLVLPQKKIPKNKKLWLALAVIGTGIIVFVLFSSMQEIIRQYPIDYAFSDIIPTIQQQVQRFIQGEKVYQPIVFGTYSYPSGYLPGTWLPFIPAALLQIDFRWVPMIAFVFAIILLLIYQRKKIEHPAASFAMVLIPFTLYQFIHNNPDVAGFSVELLISVYYLLFALHMHSKNYLLTGVLLSLCLLSRYTLVLWLPLFFFILFLDHNKQALFRIGISTFSMVLLIYILPFFIKDPQVILHGLLSYGNSGIAEWTHIDAVKQLPEHLTKGVGFAYFFYKIPHIEIIKKIQLMQVVLFSLLLLFNIVMLIVYWKYRQQVNRKIFLLGSLKIYLTLFYTFIHVPYIYLYTVPLMISVGIIFQLAIFSQQAEP